MVKIPLGHNNVNVQVVPRGGGLLLTIALLTPFEEEEEIEEDRTNINKDIHHLLINLLHWVHLMQQVVKKLMVCIAQEEGIHILSVHGNKNKSS